MMAEMLSAAGIIIMKHFPEEKAWAKKIQQLKGPDAHCKVQCSWLLRYSYKLGSTPSRMQHFRKIDLISCSDPY
jgi:hypothetical protein